jgi:hypothetical protein
MSSHPMAILILELESEAKYGDIESAGIKHSAN